MGYINETSIFDNPDWPEALGAAIRRRAQERRALLQRATPDAPTDGTVALAHAHLADEPWFQRLPNNALEDRLVGLLARQIDSAIEEWLRAIRNDDQQEARRLQEDGQ